MLGDCLACEAKNVDLVPRDTGIVFRYGSAGMRQVLIKSKKPDAPKRYREKQADCFKKDEQTGKRKCSFDELVFSGRQIHLGIALCVIWELRCLKGDGARYRRHVLETFASLSAMGAAADGSVLSEQQQFLSRLLSRLFRPEGKFPVALRLTMHDPQDVEKPEGDQRYLEDGTENPKVMRLIKLEARRKQIQARLHVTRQQGGSANRRRQLALKKSDAKTAALEETKQAQWDKETKALEEELSRIEQSLPKTVAPTRRRKKELKVSP